MRAEKNFSKFILQVLVPISAIVLRVQQEEEGSSKDGPGQLIDRIQVKIRETYDIFQKYVDLTRSNLRQ